MNIERITKEDLKAISPGQTKIFILPTRQRCMSARSSCANMKMLGEGEFRTSIDFDNKTISITRIK